MNDDDDKPERPAVYAVGMALDALSIDELNAQIALLEGEIARIRKAISDKTDSRSAADSVFKI